MKKTIIALTLVVAIAIALSITIPTLAANTGTDVTTITGHVKSVIEVSPAISSIPLGDLTPGGTNPAVIGSTTVTVKCNTAWTLAAADTTTATPAKGHMISGTASLHNALLVTVPVSGDLTGTSLAITSGGHTSGTDTLVTFSQTPDWSDAPATADYTMTVTFTGTVTTIVP